MGRAVPGFQVKVLNDHGNELAPGEIGYLCVRGPTGTLYWNNPEAQRRAVRNGWNVPGDFGYMDSEGYFWFVARSDDLIKTRSYRIEPTEVEAAILKQFHELGWTAYTRLSSSYIEDPKSRSISMLQGGSVLTVFLGHPSDAANEVFVQTTVNISNKTLPIPPDSGWIEFDNSTDLQMVVNTKMDLKRTVEFYDKEMAAEGWLARDAGR